MLGTMSWLKCYAPGINPLLPTELAMMSLRNIDAVSATTYAQIGAEAGATVPQHVCVDCGYRRVSHIKVAEVLPGTKLLLQACCCH